MRGFILLALTLLLTVPALAEKETETPNNTTRTRSEPRDSIRPTEPIGGEARGGTSFMEDFESYPLGALGTQGGWSHFPGVVEVVAPGIDGQSARHRSDGFGFSGFDLESPIFFRDFHTFAQDVTVTGGLNGSTYHVIPVDSTGIFINRISFEPNGDILYTRLNAGQTGFDFFDSGVDWTSGVPVKVQINTFANGTMEILLDNALVFSGPEPNFELSGIPGQTDVYTYWSDNVGTGDFGGTGSTLTIDNLTTDPVSVPTLGEWGMIAFVLLLTASAVFYSRKRRLA